MIALPHKLDDERGGLHMARQATPSDHLIPIRRTTPWYLRWWILAIAAYTFFLCVLHPIGQYQLSRRAVAYRVYPLLNLSVARVEGTWVVGPFLPTTEQSETLIIYKPQDFYHGFLAPVEREHRKFIVHYRAVSRGREDDIRTMLGKVEEHLAQQPQSTDHAAAREIVHELRVSPDTHTNGAQFYRSDRYASPLGYLQLAALFASFAVLCTAGFQCIARWTKRLHARLGPKPGHCQFCQYDLAGTSGTRCPECGKEPE